MADSTATQNSAAGAHNQHWTATATQAGTYEFNTAGTYVDRDIDLVVPAGSASVTAKTITKNPTISWDSTNKKIKATYSGSGTVSGSVTPGWVSSISDATVSTSGTTSVDASTLDADLVAANIKAGVEILGVTGTLSGDDFDTTEVTRDGNTVSWGTGWVEAGSSTGDTTNLVKGAGTATAAVANGNGVSLGSKTTTKPTSGRYITVTGKGNVKVESAGWIDVSNLDSNTQTAYYPVNVTDGSISTSSFNTTSASGSDLSGYTENTTAVVPTGGALKLSAGYYPNTFISLKTLVPDSYSDKTLATTASMRTGYFAWDKDGAPIVGAMGNATVKSGDVSVTAVSPSYNSTKGLFDVSATASAAAPSVTAGGYIDSSTGTKNTNSTVSSSATLAKIALSASKTSGDLTKAPTLARTAKPSGDTWTDAANGAATTTKPTSGAYIQIDAAANTGTLKISPNVATAGYGDTTNYGATAWEGTVGSAKATTAYVPIKGGSLGTSTLAANASSTNVSLGTKATSAPGSGYYIKVEGSGSRAAGTTGWINAGAADYTTATAYYPVTTGALATTGSTISSVSGTVGTGTVNTSTWKYTVPVTLSASGTAYAKVSTAGYVTSNQNTTGTAISGSGSTNVVLDVYSGSYTIS